MAIDSTFSLRERVDALRQTWAAAPPPISANAQEEMISVSPATERIAYAYERFRNILEPEEEDILRRKAIFRILERRLPQDRPTTATATALIQELVRARYIEPATVGTVRTVADILERTRHVTTGLDQDTTARFLRMAAVSVDRIFHSHQRQLALLGLMFEDTQYRVTWTEDAFVEREHQATQLYVACYRALYNTDNDEILYVYFTRQFPHWENAQLTAAESVRLRTALPAFFAAMDHVLDHPAQFRLLQLMRPVAVPYRILGDLLAAKDGRPWESEVTLKQAANQAVTARMQDIRLRMSKRSWHSILFLFFTKTLLAIFVELPYELLLLGQIHWLALGSNIAFHPLLLFFASTSARLPGEQNAQHIMDQVNKIVTGQGELPTVVISAPRKYGTVTWAVFAIVYVLLFMSIFWTLFRLLDALEFSLVGIFFFVVFLGLVSFLSVRIRRSVTDIRVIRAREGVISTMFNFLTLPVLEFGRWLTENISQLNIFLFLMDRVLEEPVKLFIDVAEEWFAFVRDRKEEIV